MSPTPPRRCLVIGGSSGLGEAIAKFLVTRGDLVMIVGRDASCLESAAERIRKNAPSRPPGEFIRVFQADVSRAEGAEASVAAATDAFGGMDVLVNVVGVSDRGSIGQLATDRLQTLLDANIKTALLCSQASVDPLSQSRGVIVNIGSLAGKVGARYLGGYPIAKHGVAALTQQLRLEWRELGIHVGVVHPGPIRREDAGSRYEDRVGKDIPDSAAQPGGGTRVKGLDPMRVAKAVAKIIDRRNPEIILPGYLRLLIVIGQAFPRIGDWLLIKFTSRPS